MTGAEAQKGYDKKGLEREERAGRKGQEETEDDGELEREERTGGKGHEETGDEGELEREERTGGKGHEETGDEGELEREEITGGKGQEETDDEGELEREERAGGKGQEARARELEAEIEQQEINEEGELERTGGKGQEETEEEGELEREAAREEEMAEEGEQNVLEIGGAFLPDHPFLVKLRQYLTSRHGRGCSEGEAKVITSAVSKYLSFAGPTLESANLYNINHLDEYLKAMEVQKRKPGTQYSFLCRLKQALAYVDITLDSVESLKAAKSMTVINNWIKRVGKEMRKHRRNRLEDMSEAGREQSMGDIHHFATSDEMQLELQRVIEKIQRGQNVQQPDLRRIMVWLAGSLLHTNSQRPGAIVNATLTEYERATLSTVDRKAYKTFLVANHKTGTTGRAKVSASRQLATNLDKFVTNVRPKLDGSSSQLLFPNREGRAIDHLSRHVQNLSKKLGFKLPLTATATRHAVATAVAGIGQTEREAVATAMSHSAKTQQMYYVANKGKKDAVKGYNIMEELWQKEGQGSSGSRTGYSESETEAITQYFSQHVHSKVPPTMDDCRQFLADHQLERNAKQVRDKVRSLIRRS